MKNNERLIEFEAKIEVTVIAKVRPSRFAPACQDPDDNDFADFGDPAEASIVMVSSDGSKGAIGYYLNDATIKGLEQEAIDVEKKET